jgi:hypothetical protein
MKEHQIDLVVHGFANDADAERQNEFFDIPMKLGKFQQISYFNGLSTTDRIQKIQQGVNEEKNGNDELISKPQWFGASLAAATKNDPTIPTDPFPLRLREVIEPHIDKARIRRKDALDAIKIATGLKVYESTMKSFMTNLAREQNFSIEESEKRQLLDAFFESTNLPSNVDLTTIHEQQDGELKDHLLHALTQNPMPFHDAYDEFVRTACVPRFAALIGEQQEESCTEVYYQSFPCLRIIQPDEFSIGPHADVAYGHHPCSVNFYVPLTKIGGASSLFLESRPGAEDWHSMEGGFGKNIRTI